MDEDPGNHLTLVPDRATSTDAYASRFSGPVGEWFLDVQREIVLAMLADVPSDALVLDVGGAHGQLAPHLAERGYRVVVLGTAPECGRRLPSLPSSDYGELSYVVSQLHRLPFRDGEAAAVVSVRVLAHIRGWRKFVAELCRVASGPVVTDYPARASMNLAAGALYAVKNRVEGDTTRPFRVLPRSAVREAFRDAGFGVTKSRPQYFWPMALHRFLGRRWMAAGLEAPFRWSGITELFGSPVVARAEPKVHSGSGSG